jgi:hypothetical protein
MRVATVEPGNAPLDDAQPAATDTPSTGTPTATEPTAGHQASDATLPEAQVTDAPNELEKVETLKRPEPTLFADIDLTNQRMTVSDASGQLGSWKISSARGGYRTPTGTYTVDWTSRMHYSKQYHWSPMPYSVFYVLPRTVACACIPRMRRSSTT